MIYFGSVTNRHKQKGLDMSDKIGFSEIYAKLDYVNAKIDREDETYMVIKKRGAPGYEIRTTSGNHLVTGEFGLTKEGLIGVLSAISYVHGSLMAHG